MQRIRMLAGVSFVSACVLLLAVPAANAANSPTFRDCSLAGGLDPDFVQLLGATVSPQGTLTVRPSQNALQLEASESSDPGDSAGHVTLTATASSSQAVTRTVSGAGIGKIFLSIPLVGSGAGKSYTISWAATFDNGMHQCPSAFTPENAGPNPFVVTVG